MKSLKIASFNVENLFNRYAALDIPWKDRNYEQFVQAVSVVSIASRKGDLVDYATTDVQRNNTALAILEAKPDILAVQEIENIYTLRNFDHIYLDGYFDRMVSIDGNDLRGIDVGVLLRKGLDVKIINIRTHIDDADSGEYVTRQSVANFGYVVRGAIFSRDCLEVDLKVDDKTITLLVNHLKAQDATPGSAVRRRKQAERVAEIVKEAHEAGKIPIVLGDLNAPDGDSTLDPLLKSPFLKDPFPDGTWTHYYIPEKSMSRLDYILPHKSIEVMSTDVIRTGLTTKCKEYPGPRFPTIGPMHTEASDHCPVVAVIHV